MTVQLAHQANFAAHNTWNWTTTLWTVNAFYSVSVCSALYPYFCNVTMHFSVLVRTTTDSLSRQNWRQWNLPAMRFILFTFSQVLTISALFGGVDFQGEKSNEACDIWQCRFWKQHSLSRYEMCPFLDYTIISRGSTCHSTWKVRRRGVKKQWGYHGECSFSRWLTALMIRGKAARCLFFLQLHIGRESSSGGG